MQNFVFYCKTYSGDYNRFEKMISTFKKYNIDNILMYVSVSESEVDIYKKYQSDNIIIITDESYASNYITDSDIAGFIKGYINQQICKLTFFKTGYSKNYLCLDSDVIFIRNFYINDFMYNNDTPYTVLIMDKDLLIQKYYKCFKYIRQGEIKKIYDYIGLEDNRFRTCHGFQILSSVVLNSLENDFLLKKQLTFIDLLTISPFEFTWYNTWFQKCKLIPEYAVEPFFKVIHTQEQYLFCALENIEINDIAEEYVGIVLNSNWQAPLDYKPKKIYWYLFKLFNKLEHLIT